MENTGFLQEAAQLDPIKYLFYINYFALLIGGMFYFGKKCYLKKSSKSFYPIGHEFGIIRNLVGIKIFTLLCLPVASLCLTMELFLAIILYGFFNLAYLCLVGNPLVLFFTICIIVITLFVTNIFVPFKGKNNARSNGPV